jgi:hypothetical protein
MKKGVSPGPGAVLSSWKEAEFCEGDRQRFLRVWRLRATGGSGRLRRVVGGGAFFLGY